MDQNELMGKKHKKVCMTLNYIEHFLILASVVGECVLISAFPSSFGIPIGIRCSTAGLKICTATAGINRYQSIIKTKGKRDITT